MTTNKPSDEFSEMVTLSVAKHGFALVKQLPSEWDDQRTPKMLQFSPTPVAVLYTVGMTIHDLPELVITNAENDKESREYISKLAHHLIKSKLETPTFFPCDHWCWKPDPLKKAQAVLVRIPRRLVGDCAPRIYQQLENFGEGLSRKSRTFQVVRSDEQGRLPNNPLCKDPWYKQTILSDAHYAKVPDHLKKFFP